MFLTGFWRKVTPRRPGEHGWHRLAWHVLTIDQPSPAALRAAARPGRLDEPDFASPPPGKHDLAAGVCTGSGSFTAGSKDLAHGQRFSQLSHTGVRHAVAENRVAPKVQRPQFLESRQYLQARVGHLRLAKV